MILKIKRATAAIRAALGAGDPAQSELIHETDTDDLYIGDGTTAGGILIADASEIHAESHTVASHSDTTATGTELETLTDGSNADALHVHAGGSGDVVGPGVAVDENIAVFDSTTGKLIKDGLITKAQVEANTAKDTNVSTNLSEGTSTLTTVDVDSSDGTNATLVAASTARAGLLTKAKWDEIVANTSHQGVTGGIHEDWTSSAANLVTTGDITTNGGVVAAEEGDIAARSTTPGTAGSFFADAYLSLNNGLQEASSTAYFATPTAWNNAYITKLMTDAANPFSFSHGIDVPSINEAAVTAHEGALTVSPTQAGLGNVINELQVSSVSDTWDTDYSLKGTPISGDYLVIEDSAAGNAKKYITVGSLPSGGGGDPDQDLYLTFIGDTGTTSAGTTTATLDIEGGTAISTVASTDKVSIALDDTGVTPGAYTKANLTVDQQGRVTSVSSGLGIVTCDIDGGTILVGTTSIDCGSIV